MTFRIAHLLMTGILLLATSTAYSSLICTGIVDPSIVNERAGILKLLRLEMKNAISELEMYQRILKLNAHVDLNTDAQYVQTTLLLNIYNSTLKNIREEYNALLSTFSLEQQKLIKQPAADKEDVQHSNPYFFKPLARLKEDYNVEDKIKAFNVMIKDLDRFRKNLNMDYKKAARSPQG